MRSTTSPILSGNLDNAEIDRIYASGFNDANDGKLYGASLGQFIKTAVDGAAAAATAAGGASDDGFTDEFADSYDDKYDPGVGGVNAGEQDNSLGFAGTISLALGGKLIYDLGAGANGGWNVANFPDNAKKLGPMRMAMPLFGIVKVAPKLLKMFFGK